MLAGSDGVAWYAISASVPALIELGEAQLAADILDEAARHGIDPDITQRHDALLRNAHVDRTLRQTESSELPLVVALQQLQTTTTISATATRKPTTPSRLDARHRIGGRRTPSRHTGYRMRPAR